MVGSCECGYDPPCSEQQENDWLYSRELPTQVVRILLRYREVPDSKSPAGRLVTLADDFRKFSQPLQANAGTVSQIRARPLPSTPSLTYYSIILPCYNIQCELLKASLRKPQIAKQRR